MAKFFENQIEGSTWHRDLVNRMGHEIPELRPALLRRDQLEHFHELRSFRHTFRSLYDRTLDPRRVKLAAESRTQLLRRTCGRSILTVEAAMKRTFAVLVTFAFSLPCSTRSSI